MSSNTGSANKQGRRIVWPFTLGFRPFLLGIPRPCSFHAVSGLLTVIGNRGCPKLPFCLPFYIIKRYTAKGVKSLSLSLYCLPTLLNPRLPPVVSAPLCWGLCLYAVHAAGRERQSDRLVSCQENTSQLRQLGFKT